MKLHGMIEIQPLVTLNRIVHYSKLILWADKDLGEYFCQIDGNHAEELSKTEYYRILNLFETFSAEKSVNEKEKEHDEAFKNLIESMNKLADFYKKAIIEKELGDDQI